MDNLLKSFAERHQCGKTEGELMIGVHFSKMEEMEFLASFDCYLPKELQLMCLAYWDLPEQRTLFEQNQFYDNLITTETQNYYYDESLRWVLSETRTDGVCNVLVKYGRRDVKPVECFFCTMFVLVAKYYGLERFFKVLKYLGVPPQSNTNSLLEVCNIVAEMYNKIDSKCDAEDMACMCSLFQQ